MSQAPEKKRLPVRSVLALSGLLALLLAAPLILLGQSQYALLALNWAAKTFGDIELVWVAPELDIYGGRAAARELHLVFGGVSLLSLYGVKAETRLQDILTLNLENSRLSGRSAVLYLPAGEDAADGETADALSYLGFLPRELSLGSGHVVVDGDPVWVFQLDGVSGKGLSADRYQLKTLSIYQGDALDVDLELHAVVAGEVATALAFDATLLAAESDSEVSVSGELASPGSRLTFDVQVDARFGDVDVFLRGLDAPGQLAGSLAFSGRVRGDTGEFRLSELDARLDNGEAYRLSARGDLDYAMTGESRLALLATGTLASVQTLLPDVDLGPGDFGEVSARIELSGSLDVPVIDAFRLDTRNEAGLELGLSGRLSSLREAATRAGQNQLSISASAASLAALEPWLGKLPWESGAWRAEFELQEVAEVISLDDLRIVAGDEQSLALSARGRVANVARVIEEQVHGLEGVDLDLSLVSADAGAVARWFEFPPLAGHALAGQLRLKGSGRALAGSGGTLQLSTEGLELQAKDIALAIDLLAEDPVVEASVPVRLAASDVALLGRYVGTDLPALGPLEADFELLYGAGRLDLRSARLRGPASGGVLGFDLGGGAADLLVRPQIDLTGTLQLRDPALLESLTGLRMARGQGELKLRLDEGRASLDADLRLGDTPLDLAIEARLAEAGLAGVDLALASPRLRLEDLGLQSVAAEDETYSPAQRIGEQGEGLSLAPLLAAVPDYPLSLQLRAGQILGENTDLQDFVLEADARGDRLTLRRLEANSGPASLELLGVVDRGQLPVATSLAGQAFGVPTGMITSDLGIDADFAGTLSASLGLTAYGSSGDALLESLGGHFTFAVKDAVVEGAAYDVLATDLLGWIYKGAALETETRIDCGMADFTLRDGVATSDRLYVETDQMLASGTAEFNLVQESLDVTLTPLSKSRAFQVPSAVRLRGPFTDPQPEISPFSAAADAYAAWLTLVPQITLEIFGYKGQAGKQQQPCRIWGDGEGEE